MYDWAIAWLMDAVNWLISAVNWLGEFFYRNLAYLWENLQALGNWVWTALKGSLSALWRGLKALAHLNFKSIWSALKRGYERIRRALDWYMRRVQAPLDRLRRQIWDVYRRFFKPILQVLDSFRVMVRVVALFNRKLAAKLDARLFSLESKLMWPITAALHRINELASYQRALVTALGYLDRVTFLETLRRDALLVWQVLTNPLGRIYAKPTPPAARTQQRRLADSEEFARYRTGYYADAALRLDGVWHDLEAEG